MNESLNGINLNGNGGITMRELKFENGIGGIGYCAEKWI